MLTRIEREVFESLGFNESEYNSYTTLLQTLNTKVSSISRRCFEQTDRDKSHYATLKEAIGRMNKAIDNQEQSSPAAAIFRQFHHIQESFAPLDIWSERAGTDIGSLPIIPLQFSDWERVPITQSDFWLLQEASPYIQTLVSGVGQLKSSRELINLSDYSFETFSMVLDILKTKNKYSPASDQLLFQTYFNREVHQMLDFLMIEPPLFHAINYSFMQTFGITAENALVSPLPVVIDLTDASDIDFHIFRTFPNAIALRIPYIAGFDYKSIARVLPNLQSITIGSSTSPVLDSEVLRASSHFKHLKHFLAYVEEDLEVQGLLQNLEMVPVLFRKVTRYDDTI